MPPHLCLDPPGLFQSEGRFQSLALFRERGGTESEMIDKRAFDAVGADWDSCRSARPRIGGHERGTPGCQEGSPLQISLKFARIGAVLARRTAPLRRLIDPQDRTRLSVLYFGPQRRRFLSMRVTRSEHGGSEGEMPAVHQRYAIVAVPRIHILFQMHEAG